MKARYILFAASALMLTACVGDVVQTDWEEGIQMTVRAWQEGSADTKTTVVDGGKQVYWEPSDEIKVFFNGSSGRFISNNTQNSTVAEFTGTLNVIVGAMEGANYSTQTWGLYPYRADATIDGESLITTLPASQNGKAGSFAKNTNITVARSNNYGLAFYNVCGGLRFSLTQEGIKKVTFEGNNGETLAGKIKIAFADGIPVVQEVSEAETMLTLTAPGGGTFQTGQWYYLSAVPGTLSKGFKMVFHKETESAKLSSSSSVSFSRGKFGSLTDADEGLIFKETAGEDPNDVIQFADPIAKYACVEKFDTNNDGEVSYAEAAAATSLEGLFTDWNTVASFEEIKYFTGVTSTSGVFTGLKNLTYITIPDNITTLGTFQNCTALETVVLPAALTSLPEHCFDGCAALKNVTLPTGITSIPDYCFRNCSALLTFDFPSSVTSLGQYTFSDCTALTSVVLPNGITEIPSSCFRRCTSLKIIVWPQALTTIGNYAFEECRFKEDDYTLELPATVTSIGKDAFYHLHHLIIPSASPVSVASYSFVSWSTFIYVPADMVEMYKVMKNWSDHSYYIRPIDDYPVRITAGGTVGQAVDLGLSVKWASWNVGASAPEEYGDYFSWGMTEPNYLNAIYGWSYSWSDYKWCIGNSSILTKYNTDSSLGTIDNKTTLDLEDDAAHVNWGGTWRMPTMTEVQELKDNCTAVWTRNNGVYGCRFTSKKDGHTDKSIFLPAAGSRNDHSLESLGSYGNYWSSSLFTDYPGGAFVFVFAYYNSTYPISGGARYLGHSIRPVTP